MLHFSLGIYFLHPVSPFSTGNLIFPTGKFFFPGEKKSFFLCLSLVNFFFSLAISCLLLDKSFLLLDKSFLPVDKIFFPLAYWFFIAVLHWQMYVFRWQNFFSHRQIGVFKTFVTGKSKREL